MKRILFLFLLNITIMLGYAQTPYYYYDGNRFPLEENEKKVCVIQLKEAEKLFAISDISKEYIMESAAYDMQVVAIENIVRRKGLSKSASAEDVKSMATGQDIVVWPIYKSEQAAELILSGMISVKLKKEEDTTILKTVAAKYKLNVVGTYEYLPLWYTLQTTMASGNPLEIANAMFEENLFASSYPEFLQVVEPSCVSDAYFRSQWGLKNTQYSNVDISACDAWNLSTGKGQVIAIIDIGVDVAHRDLVNNISSYSYDAMSGTSPSKIYVDNSQTKVHGTHCAGIAAAVADNGIDVAGVAPDAKIMPISYDFLSSATTSLKLANGISWAWQHGADILSCSWNGTSVDAIKEAINMATTQGRNGFGCIVVVSSGNHNGNESATVKFPATLSNVIAVGAISQNGEIANTSNYGSAINVCAPGVSIFSTIPNNQTLGMSGTSMACPHVSGLAALILEVNPKLNTKEVQDIIETTTKKVGNLAYSSTKTNGTWNEKHGYGLIDAYSAVVKAKTYCPAVELKNQTITNERTIIGCSVNLENVSVKQGGKLNFDASKVVITAPFSMEAGTQLTIK